MVAFPHCELQAQFEKSKSAIQKMAGAVGAKNIHSIAGTERAIFSGLIILLREAGILFAKAAFRILTDLWNANSQFQIIIPMMAIPTPQAIVKSRIVLSAR